MSVDKSIRLSAVVIIFNEARNLRRCITSLLPIADEILFVDSFSTDEGPEIIAEFIKTYPNQIRLVQHNWLGFAEMKNYANSLANHDYLLSVDADEIPDETLTRFLIELKQHPPEFPFALRLRRLPFYCGQPIYHSGWNPDRKIRFFYKNKGKWEGKFVHEKLKITDPSVRVLPAKGLLLHYTYESISEHVTKLNRYTDLSKAELQSKDQKATAFHLILKPAFEFFRCYILKRGFADGKAGLVVSMMNAYDKFLRYAKLYLEK